MRVDFSLNQFPASGLVKDRCGLPFSCVVQPFSKLDKAQAQIPPADAIARCPKCYSYTNSHCHFDVAGWVCAICGHFTAFRPYASDRYKVSPATRDSLPEIASNVFEALVEEPTLIEAGANDVSGPAPIYIAVVDVSGGEDFLELVRSALLASLEALPPAAQFGLITFSNKIGLHDVRSPTPCARYIPIFESSPLLVPLAELMPLPALLATVGAHKDSIAAALEALVAEQEATPSSSAPQNGAGNLTQRAAVHQGKHGFGPTLLAILDYLKAVKGPPFQLPLPTRNGNHASMHDQLPPAQSPVRLMTFLSGMPDLGPGKLINPCRRQHQQQQKQLHAQQRAAAAVTNGSEAGAAAQMMGQLGLTTEEDGDWLQDVSPETRMFYEQAAVAAASLGVCIDLYAISSSAVGLPILEPISNSTGGAMYLYPSTDESALPQDMYRRLSGLHASSGLLRIRTTPVLKPVRFYGRLYSDPSIPNLHHVIAADSADTFAVDFDFDKGAVFESGELSQNHTPVVQVAFQYTVVVPVEESEDASSSGGKGASFRLVLQRRLRVATYKLEVAKTPLDLYIGANTEAVVAVLMQKIMRAARSKGPSAARLLLRDWLVILSANYHRIVNRTLPRDQLLATPVDLAFSTAPPLARLPRMVYALLRSPLLAPPVDGQHPDLNTFLEHLWSCLPPSELVTAVYPSLSSWADPDNMVLLRHSLSRASLSDMAIQASGRPSAPIFLLDAYIMVIVFYTSACPSNVPYPPPQQSALRSAIGAIRHERKITPLVRIVREGTADADIFHQLLLDEPEDHPVPTQSSSQGDEAPAASQFGLEQFMAHIHGEVGLQLQAEMPIPTTPKQ